ncbi:cytochrome c [Marinobacter sp. CAU 1620]|nr:cytochrome c [Marinobacter arenosus]
MIKHSVVSLACLLLMTNAVADELAEQGRKVFIEEAQPACTVCHTLSDAGSAGEIGPNLDELAPSATQVRNAVKGGVGIMPAFGESLSEAQITAVAHYVASVTGGEP